MRLHTQTALATEALLFSFVYLSCPCPCPCLCPCPFPALSLSSLPCLVIESSFFAPFVHHVCSKVNHSMRTPKHWLWVMHDSCIMLHRPWWANANQYIPKKKWPLSIWHVRDCDCIDTTGQNARATKPRSTPHPMQSTSWSTPYAPKSRSFMSPLRRQGAGVQRSPSKRVSMRPISRHVPLVSKSASSSILFASVQCLPYMSTHLAQHPASCSPLSMSMGLGGPFAPDVPPLPVE